MVFNDLQGSVYITVSTTCAAMPFPSAITCLALYLMNLCVNPYVSADLKGSSTCGMTETYVQAARQGSTAMPDMELRSQAAVGKSADLYVRPGQLFFFCSMLLSS